MNPSQSISTGTNSAPQERPFKAVEIKGELVLFHEYSFVDELELKPYISAFIADIGMLISSPFAVTTDDIEELLHHHGYAVTVLVVKSARKDFSWVTHMSKSDRNLAIMGWWWANAIFFINRAKELLLGKQSIKVIIN